MRQRETEKISLFVVIKTSHCRRTTRTDKFLEEDEADEIFCGNMFWVINKEDSLRRSKGDGEG